MIDDDNSSSASSSPLLLFKPPPPPLPNEDNLPKSTVLLPGELVLRIRLCFLFCETTLLGTKYDDDDVPTVLDNEVVPNNVFLRRDSSDNRPTLLKAANHNAFSFLREGHLNAYRM